MMNKLLLAAIALGLFANAWATLVQPTQAQSSDLNLQVSLIQEHLYKLVYGECLNTKLCSR
jgi:hypothetical protein